MTGDAALELLRERPFDLVLLDMNMPGSSGLETCRAIRAGSEVAIIMLTVRDSEADTVAALDAGADDYVTKPFNTPELLARMRAALRRSRGRPRPPRGRWRSAPWSSTSARAMCRSRAARCA
jgi:DNA-binding response OmpR family regulator